MKRLLLHGGGTWHDFVGVAAVLADALAPVARVTYSEDPGRLSRAGLGGFDALAVYTCYAAGDDALTDKSRAAVPGHAQRAVEDFVAAGAAFLPLHGAVCSYPGWRGLYRMIGAEWIWGMSGHDPQETFTARWVRSHPLWAGAEDITQFDEKYHALRPLRPLRRFLEAEWRGAVQPMGWTTTFGRGRVVYSALGHTPAAMAHPAHASLLRRGLTWALGGGKQDRLPLDSR